ncbi:MAG: hypothetical protein ACU84J_04655 [Gammaproteobacteria bacterium]
MTKQRAFDLLALEFDLKPADFYFLDLIPLIEMMWADGQNQEAELALLYKFTVEHIAYLDREAGLKFASIDDANDFLDRFAHRKPSPHLLEKLRELVVPPEDAPGNHRHKTILDYCLDIAAACTTQYPFGMQERIMAGEKELLVKLFSAFNRSVDEIIL